MNGDVGRFFAAITGLVVGLLSVEAMADVDVGKLVTLTAAKVPDLSPLSGRANGKMRLFVAGPDVADAQVKGLTSLRTGLYAFSANADEVKGFVEQHPNHRVTWMPPRRMLLDNAVKSVRANVARDTYGLTGAGVVVGIADTGIDVRHPDLQDAAGKTRVAWMLDLSRTPTGKYPELEQQFGCNDADYPCAVYAGTDIDELIGNEQSGDEPRDIVGHGTHVASLAAGNGRSTVPAKYVGMAPEASLVVVRVSRDEAGGVQDPDILLATQFIFTMADEMGMPAVANLSLGGDFGAHDGTSVLEQELSALVDDSHPGRSIVVAGGNGGILYASPEGSNYSEPLGIHATVQVPPYSAQVRVPLLVDRSANPTVDSEVYIWVTTRPGDNLSVGLASRRGSLVAPVGFASSASVEQDGYKVLIANGVKNETGAAGDGAYVFVQGAFEDGEEFALTFEGQGTASVWVQPNGGIGPSSSAFGALLPAAQREGTVTVPATAPALIAVGASLDRAGWVDVEGNQQSAVYPIVRSQVEGEIVPFSAAGPNALDGIKPDIVAPGAYVVGAMSKLTDPSSMAGENGMFAGSQECSAVSRSCLVVDDYHAISLGTSMASPIVAGAVALLLEDDPTLTQAQLLRALQSGARNPFDFYATTTQTGAGLLDVEGALLALRNQAPGNVVSSAASYLTLGVSFVRPEPDWSVAGMVHLRDDRGRAVDVATERLALRVQHGQVTSKLTREGPGFYRFAVSGAADSGGQLFVVSLLLDGKGILRDDRAIAVDASNVRKYAVAGRGCSFAAAATQSPSVVAGLLVLAATVGRRRRRR